MHQGIALRQSARLFPNKPAVVSGGSVLTFPELDTITDQLAGWLAAQGLDFSSRVAIHWSNSIETVVLFYACFKAGVIAVPVNNRLKAPEIAYILNHSKARFCFSQPELAHLTESIRHECPHLQGLFTALPALEGLPAPPLAAVAVQQVATVLYTSGTTARPKGVMHTHISLTGATELMVRLGLDDTHTVLATTQMMHIAALACVVLPAIACGATAVLMPVFEPAQALDLIERWRCTYMLTLPALLRFLVEEQTLHPRDVGSMRLCLAGGDTVPAMLQENFRAHFPIPVREMFGMTESVPVIANPPDAPRVGSMGQVVPLVEARIVGKDGQELGPGELGELQVQSMANCIGYWDDPLATDAAWDKGWLRTGDLARCDADGYYWFEGRAKQIIVRAGSNISPQEVEEALYHHPAVLECGVIGMPDERLGERVVAFAALRPGMQATGQELRELCGRLIADYKVPERIVFLDALPKGLTGKILRRELRQFYPD